MTDLTAANAIVTLTAPGVYNTPFTLQEYAADDIFSSPQIEAGEGSMGVDGVYSAGFYYKEVSQEYTLQGNSPSNKFFDDLYAFEQANLTKVPLTGSTTLLGLGLVWVQTRGFLMMYNPIVSAGRIVKPRKHEIRWNLVAPQPA
jgi:hypothetical protein